MPNDQSRLFTLGFDVGSVACKVVVTDAGGTPQQSWYRRTFGRPQSTTHALLNEAIEQFGLEQIGDVVGTGSAGRLICQALDVPFVNEVVAQARALRQVAPQARTLIEMGGQDSKLIVLGDGGDARVIARFAMNTSCAAGTGSFLDQQASRLGIRIEEQFEQLALQSESPPRVAGRCSVFAKSDMIHLQQKATPVHDILAGLCLALARGLAANLRSGMKLPPPIAFCGGVAANGAVVRAIEQVLKLEPGALIVPPQHAVSGALGAALTALDREDDTRKPATTIELERLDQGATTNGNGASRLQPLDRAAAVYAPAVSSAAPTNGSAVEAYLGLDVGSISTKVAIVDSRDALLAKRYMMTAGRPLDAVRRVLGEVEAQLDRPVRICGAATTGSGRYLTADFIGADLVIDEITAQATAATVIDPQVDTIFEIGGQDSKFIRLQDGVVVDFEMNHACAAGTGSFLEEQAERLGIDISSQFARLAFSSRRPAPLGDRCTVFMESDLLSRLQNGATTEDLVAGLAYSIVSNYLCRVVGRRSLGRRIFFQGGTAFNEAVVAAFAQTAGQTVVVPPHHEVTGAIGAAVLARRRRDKQPDAASTFGGFRLGETDYDVRSFKCSACSNDCEINEVKLPERSALYYGSRCDRFNRVKTQRDDAAWPDLFRERHAMLLHHAQLDEPSHSEGPTVGIPLALTNFDLLPLWSVLFRELGWNVTTTPMSNRRIVQQGVEAVLSTPCFPVKVAHGHVMELLDGEADFVWLPSVRAVEQEANDDGPMQLCPYIPALPHSIEAALKQHGRQAQLLTPSVRLDEGVGGLVRSLSKLAQQLGVSRRKLRRAAQAAWRAQAAFGEACRTRGREVLDSLPADQRALVLVSRPYSACDTGAFLDLPAKIRSLGVPLIPMDFLDTADNGGGHFREMYWQYGRKILRTANVIRGDGRLYPIYLSSFSCGPDSFLVNYFRRLVAPKPSLLLELDEHSAAAGIVTRLEAFMRSLPEKLPQPMAARASLNGHAVDFGVHRKLFIPWMGDQSLGLAAAFRAFGQPADVLPLADGESIELGRRHCSGKECLPCVMTAGDMIRLTRQPDFDRHGTAFLMPGGSGPCRFGQYNCLHQLVLDDAGLPDVPVIAPSQDRNLYSHWKQFPGDVVGLGWYAICAFDLLNKVRLATRPFERVAGQTNEVYQEVAQRLCQRIESRPTERMLVAELARAAERFAAVPLDRDRRRPRIGMVGEVYVRLHNGANDDLIEQLERLGAEVTLAGYPEWHHYTNWVRMQDARRQRRPGRWLVSFQKDRIQRARYRRLAAPFRRLLGHAEEPPSRKLVRLAEPHLDRQFRGGDAVLALARTIQFQRDRYDGVVNVMPFSCMPSTVVDGVLKSVGDVLCDMPVLTLSFEGQQDPSRQTRLEAFVYQARCYGANR